MKSRACRENIVDQEDTLAFDARGIVYGEGPVQIRETFFFRKRRLRRRRPDPEKTRQSQWDLEMLTQAMRQQE
jgi:hypothetical protein